MLWPGIYHAYTDNYHITLYVEYVTILICYNTHGQCLTDIHIHATPKGAQCLRESAYTSRESQSQSCCNIYVTVSIQCISARLLGMELSN